MYVDNCVCYLTWHDYPSLVEGESHGILKLLIILKKVGNARPLKKQWPCSWNLPVPHHQVQVSEIISQRYGQENENPVVLRGFAVSVSVPMCDQALHVTHTGTYGPGRAPRSGCIGLQQMLYSIYNTATDQWYARSHSNTPQVKILSPLTTWSSSLRCVSAADHHTAKQYSKMRRTKPRKHHPEAI